MKINLIDYCLSANQGKTLYFLLNTSLKKGIKIEINFFAVRVLSSDFLEESIGKLMKYYNKNQIYSNIKFSGLNKNQERSIKFTVDFYYKYHRDKKYREIIDLAFNKKDKKQDYNVETKKRKRRKKDPIPLYSI